MKKIISFIIVMFALIGIYSVANYNSNLAFAENSKIEVVDKAAYVIFNDFYSPAFQLIWNDFSDKLVKDEVNFVGGNPILVQNLNERKIEDVNFSKKDLYKIVASQTIKTKKKIERDLKRKFDEKSELLDSLEWSKKPTDKTILYSMFKKDILFSKAFNELYPMSFDKSKNTYKFFGVTSSQNIYSDVIQPVFYKDKNSYAVILNTKTNDEIILYTTNSNDSVFKIWDDLNNKYLSKKMVLTFDKKSELKVPEIEFEKLCNYKELLGKRVVGTNFVIGTALEKIDFTLDKEGAKIKNEAIMGVERMSLMPDCSKKNYSFDKPFILFIRTKGADVPYFALKIKDTNYLVEK